MSHIVIVGAGTAGAQTVVALQELGYEGAITLVGEEQHLPYHRPPLSKAHLYGPAEPADTLLIRPAAYYERRRVDVIAGTVARRIDRDRRVVELEDGTAIGFDKLVLATGARPRLLALEGASLDGICYLRSLPDCDALRSRLRPNARVLVVGAGYIGLEVAAAARHVGAQVIVVEMLSQVLSRGVSPEMAHFFEDVHRQHGVDIVLEASVSRFEGSEGRLAAAVLDNGERIPADVAVIGVGVVPNVELAKEAGLDVADGIVVGDQLQTTDPEIFAIGDCASFPSGEPDVSLRLESVQNASDQARCVARQLVGDIEAYDAVPWFWSQQYGHRLQIVGISRPSDDVVLRGDPSEGAFSVCRFRDGILVAIESVDRAADHLAGRRLLRRGGAAHLVTPDMARDPRVSFKDLVAQAR